MKAVATNIISHKFSSNSSVFYHSHDRGTAAQSRVARSPCVRDRANATASAPLSWRVPGHGVPSAQPHRRRGLHQHEDLLVRAAPRRLPKVPSHTVPVRRSTWNVCRC
jgi:hypothetical protein